MTVQDVELLNESEPEHVAVPERFAVCDADSANWVCRKIIEARLYADRVKEWAERKVRRAVNEEAWLTRRFGGQLEQWVRQELAAWGGGARSVKLPAGQLGLRSVPASFRTAEIAVHDLILAVLAEVVPDARPHIGRYLVAEQNRPSRTTTNDASDGVTSNISGNAWHHVHCRRISADSCCSRFFER